MKTITVTSLFILLLLISPSTIRAQESESISAFRLVNAAYQGRLKKWGIPAYAKLDQAYRGGQITALDLIKAAIEAKQLPAIALEDESYLKAVNTNLYGLVTR